MSFVKHLHLAWKEIKADSLRRVQIIIAVEGSSISRWMWTAEEVCDYRGLCAVYREGGEVGYKLRLNAGVQFLFGAPKCFFTNRSLELLLCNN
jgi:hypothetical protein